MKKLMLIAILGINFLSCDAKKHLDASDTYADGFEAYSRFDDLFLPYPDFDKQWSFNQLTRDGNVIIVDSTFSHSGDRSMRFTAQRSDENGASKASIARHNMSFWEGETVRLSAWYFIPDTTSHQWLFLMDLEEQAAIGAGPGMRIALVDDQLRIEHKYNERDIIQNEGSEIDFPRNQWVELVWEVKLFQKEKGTVKLWQDGQLIIDSQNNATLPKDILYFQQGTKGMYSSIEFGITANSSDRELTLWLDDISVEVVE